MCYVGSLLSHSHLSCPGFLRKKKKTEKNCVNRRGRRKTLSCSLCLRRLVSHSVNGLVTMENHGMHSVCMSECTITYYYFHALLASFKIYIMSPYYENWGSLFWGQLEQDFHWFSNGAVRNQLVCFSLHSNLYGYNIL